VYYFDDLEGNILYIGSAKNLLDRYKGHEVKRLLNRSYRFVFFHFHETENYRAIEVELIKSVRPKFNYQHNG
jgi:excinuclease UvrABC nuclease subunit